MLSFRKNRNKSVAERDVQLEVSNMWKSYKEKLALYLQRKFESLSVRTKKYSLIYFCLLLGGSNIAVIIYSASTKGQSVLVGQISQPVRATQTENNYSKTDSAITKTEYDKVEQFENYLFELKNDSTRSNEFDNIIKARPHLMDSINLFEKIYLQQQ